MNMRIRRKSSIALIFMVVAAILSFDAVSDTFCENVYDESYVAYSKDFSYRYNLPEKNIDEMPQYLQFIELVIRSEFGRTQCYLNFSIKRDFNAIKIPSSDYHLNTYHSSISKYLKGLISSKNGEMIAHETMSIAIFNPLKGGESDVLAFPIDVYNVESGVFFHTILTSCSVYYTEDFRGEADSYLQIQRSDFEGSYSDSRYDRLKREKYFYDISFPMQWYEKVKEAIKNLENHRRKNVNCSNKK